MLESMGKDFQIYKCISLQEFWNIFVQILHLRRQGMERVQYSLVFYLGGQKYRLGNVRDYFCKNLQGATLFHVPMSTLFQAALLAFKFAVGGWPLMHWGNFSKWDII